MLIFQGVFLFKKIAGKMKFLIKYQPKKQIWRMFRKEKEKVLPIKISLNEIDDSKSI